MGARYGDGTAVICHDLSQKLRSGQHGKLPALGLGKFRVFGMDRGGVDHQVDIRCDVPGLLGIGNSGSQRFQMLCQRRFSAVGAGDGKAFLQKDLGQAAHADAADADEMYMHWFLEIYLIHSCSLLCC